MKLKSFCSCSLFPSHTLVQSMLTICRTAALPCRTQSPAEILCGRCGGQGQDRRDIMHSERYEMLCKVSYGMIYLLTAFGLTPGGSITVHIYTQTVHRTTQLIWEGCGPCCVFKSYTVVEFYSDICLTTEEKARKILIQGSRRVPVGTMKTEYTEQSVNNNKNT